MAEGAAAAAEAGPTVAPPGLSAAYAMLAEPYVGLTPTPTVQYRWAQSRIPIEMMRHG